MLDQNSATDFYNLFVRTNELLFETLQQLKRIADYVETPYVDTEGIIKNIVDDEDNIIDEDKIRLVNVDDEDKIMLVNVNDEDKESNQDNT